LNALTSTAAPRSRLSISTEAGALGQGDDSPAGGSRVFVRRLPELLLMNERKISEALTTYAHFRKAGLSAVLV
jgi:hypothetical protein